MIRLKRAYETPSSEDGLRVLVERLWPRGVAKARAQLDLWLKDAAPSAELRKWFGHDPAKWKTFQSRYWSELKTAKAPLARLRAEAAAGTVTLVYAARDEQHNSAVALKKFLER
jgi:uncharacterized protein YeaO (DUF488 family)